MTDRRALQHHVLRALAEADPLETGLKLDLRLDEYGSEAGEIERRLTAGETMETAVAEVFWETCEIELEPTELIRIRDLCEERISGGG